MGEVSSLFVRKMLETASAFVPRASLLAELGLSEADLSDPDVMVSVRKYVAFMEELADAEGPQIKFHTNAASSMTCEDYGAVGLAWKTAPQLLTAFERIERHSRLFVKNVAGFRIEQDGEFTRWIHFREFPPVRGLLLSNEAALVTYMSLCREAYGADFGPVSVHYSHSAVGCPLALEEYFRSPVKFDADYYGYVFRTEDLLRKTPLGDTHVSSFFDSHIEKELSEREGDADLESQVRKEIGLALSDGPPPIGMIADKLGLSARTLQRRLSDAGITYQTLVDQSRHMLSRNLLRDTSYSLAEIAFLTGFSEQSAFNRAFRRWEGRPPGSFRSGA
ncbi:MAG: hypothetical protein CBB65_07835 [Hyphomonadaceae bacterium TMED5]|nr:hypothetical protein [Ponticaulis sp.]OUX99972.1 MAG: hypothetical protein CBB65_07835 [Hyphomonadaceae bacterium TMED5]|tara:strand:+ start:308285 stop:309286 length:1002 start_codon:yes stop_codon:yes gene_type:complete